MKNGLDRRGFLKSVGATAVLAGISRKEMGGRPELTARNVIRTFDYEGVRLGKSRWNDQYARARDFYFNVSNDDILQGFRVESGLVREVSSNG